MNKNYYSYAESGKLVMNKKGTTDYVENSEELETETIETFPYLASPLSIGRIVYENREGIIFCVENNRKLS